MSPHPIARHQVTIPTLRIFELSIGGVVEMAIEFRVGEDTLDHLTRVTEPDLVFRNLPLRQVSSFGLRSIVAQAEAFPRNVAK